MNKVMFETPGLFADHHVTEVKRMVMEIPGVEDVYASSAFHVVEIAYDPQKTDEGSLREVISNAGYMNDMLVPNETGIAGSESEYIGVFQRHTQAFAATNQVVAFSQQVESSGRPLWNCPGVGVLSREVLLEKMEE